MTSETNTEKEWLEQGSSDDEDVDQELLDLPQPPPSLRYALFTILIIAMSVVMLVWFFPDLRYLLRGLEGQIELGDAADVDIKSLEHNTFVSLEGIPWITKSVTLAEKRWFFSPQKFRVFPMMGQSNLYIQWTVPHEQTVWRNPKTNPSQPSWPSSFRGHLVRRDKYDRAYREVWSFIESKTKLKVAGDAWLLLDGEVPTDKSWVLLVYMLFLTMILLNILRLRRFWLLWRS